MVKNLGKEGPRKTTKGQKVQENIMFVKFRLMSNQICIILISSISREGYISKLSHKDVLYLPKKKKNLNLIVFDDWWMILDVFYIGKEIV